MKQIIFTLICLLFFYNLFAQVNLVTNGDFETKTSCNIDPGAIHLAPPWVQATLGTSDYFNVCAGLGSLLGVPKNRFGFQNAHSGDGYAGIFTYSTTPIGSNYREFIQTKLTTKLTAQSLYYIEFYVNLSDIPEVNANIVAINSFGCYFSDSAFFDSIYTNITRVPQFQTSSSVLFTDTAAWLKIQGVYKAHGGEEYITLGNFKDDASTQTQVIATSTVLPILADITYYYIDDVSIYEITSPKASRDTTICLGDSLVLGANDTAISCSWYPKMGINDSTLTNPKASPKQTTWYYVSHQNGFGYLAKDSILVTVLDCSNESILEVPNVFSPNNDAQNDLFLISAKNITSFNCKILNRYGVLVAELNELDEGWDGRNKSGVHLSDGVYFYLINAEGRDAKKYAIKGFVSLLR